MPLENHIASEGTGRQIEDDIARNAALVSKNPVDHAALDALGVALFRAHRFSEAITPSKAAVALAPNVARYQEHLGLALFDDGQLSDAAASFHTALSIDPTSFMSLLLLASMMQSAGRLPEATHYFQRAVESDPSSYQVHVRYSSALMLAGDSVGAEKQLLEAIALQPQNFLAYEFMGEVLQRRGDFAGAVVAYEQAISLNQQPRAGSFQALVAGKKITDGDRPLVDRMLARAGSSNLSGSDELYLHVGLCKAFDDLRDFGAAFKHLDIARKCAKRISTAKPFERRPIAYTTEISKQQFTKEALAGCSYGVKSDLPVLIVGMPRSGTTLLEQILSSHPQIGSAGEQSFWFNSPLAGNLKKAFDPAFASELAANYRMLLRKIGPGKKRVTDKMPLNFTFLGPIHMLFPNARILHCRRHPVDTCLSLLMNTLSSEAQSYLFELEDLVFTYKEYLKLMAHWRGVLPADRFMEVDYEEVVSDKEAMARKIIAFLELEWDDACLHHERNTRTVDTPSKWQVRQPIYSSSVARWKNYEPWLGPLRELL